MGGGGGDVLRPGWRRGSGGARCDLPVTHFPLSVSRRRAAAAPEGGVYE